MNTASEIVAYITPAALMAEVGVKRDAINKAVRSGKLPALWYDACERLAGRPLPREAFYFKGARK